MQQMQQMQHRSDRFYGVPTGVAQCQQERTEELSNPFAEWAGVVIAAELIPLRIGLCAENEFKFIFWWKVTEWGRKSKTYKPNEYLLDLLKPIHQEPKAYQQWNQTYQSNVWEKTLKLNHNLIIKQPCYENTCEFEADKPDCKINSLC